ncbi:uncharacterized protein N7511_002505 [Penicillium nucicola]|uniref:uncharacterized protein n=1 Tax=Penicillium nucicola TaxID=1850975 RepID=UPI0025459175|nr:uncharacterized protein N7511_002505 [Penicillium nucicola]KAJ5770454.1 hypothetical protein N7511_002505 [Penicillium nucicola]
MTQSLQDHINTLDTLPLTEAIKAITTLTPDLKPSIQTKYGYFVTHSAYSGIADLEDLGRLWLKSATDCFEQNAPLKVRLLHYSQTETFNDLYGGLYRALNAGLKDGSVEPPVADPEAGCSCCAGVPSSVILCGFSERDAFYFRLEEYRAHWGEQANSGSRWRDGVCYCENASLEQVQEALARDPGVEVLSML